MSLPLLKNNPSVIEEHTEIYRDYQYTVVFNDGGHRCGYVKVPPDNPAHNESYDDVRVECHGGLTYGKQDETGEGSWIGFDCAHYSDAPEIAKAKEIFPDSKRWHVQELIENLGAENPFPKPVKHVRTLEYVKEECRSIIDQLQGRL